MSTKRNYFYSFISEFITTLIPFVTLPYLSRILETDGIGEYVYAFTWAYYFMLGGRLGVRLYGSRAIARVRDDRVKLSKVFSEIYIMQLIICLTTVFLYFGFTRIWFSNSRLFLILLILVISACFEIDWFYYGIEKIKLTSLRTILINIMMALAIFLFVKSRESVWIYALITSLGALMGQLSLFVKVWGYIDFKWPMPKAAFAHLRGNLLLFLPTIATSIYRDMDKLMLGQLSGYNQLGLYENAIKLQTCMLTFITSISAVMFPRVSNLVAKGNDKDVKRYLEISSRLVIFLSSAIAFGIGGIAVEFAPLYFGKEFAQSGYLMMWLTPTIIFVCFSGLIRSQYIIPYGKDRLYLFTAIVGAIVNFGINMLLLRKIGAFGAVISTIAAEFIVVILQFITLHKDINYKKLILPNLVFIGLGGGMFLLTRIISTLGMPLHITVIIQIISGASFYLLGSVLYLYFSKDKVIIPQVSVYLKRLKTLARG